MFNGVSADSRVMSDQAVEKFFEEYGDLHHAIMDWRLGYSIVKRLMCPLAGRTVLDYGCGNGRLSRLLRDRGARVTAVDISPAAIAEARQKNGQSITYHLISSGDLSAVQYRGIEIAVSTFSLCCVRERAELDRILKAVYDRLRPGGAFVLAEPHPDSVGRQFYSMRRMATDALAEGTPIEVQMLAGSELTRHDFWHSRGVVSRYAADRRVHHRAHHRADDEHLPRRTAVARRAHVPAVHHIPGAEVSDGKVVGGDGLIRQGSNRLLCRPWSPHRVRPTGS